MKKNSLTPNKGLSLSQAQSISNLCFQKAREIELKLASVNNYTKTVDIYNNAVLETLVTVEGNRLPEGVVSMLAEKSALHACQAFLMENIKIKDSLLEEAKNAVADLSSVVMPEKPKFLFAPQLPQVTEEFGWSSLSVSEINEYIEAEAYASHIGIFIHKGGSLDNLRKELPTIKPTEWMEIEDGKKTPVKIIKHHTSEELLSLHEELAALHRNYEQRVNYFKAKVKNITQEENARIAKHNADVQNETSVINNEAQNLYETANRIAVEKMNVIKAEFEKERQAKIKEIAGMRISIDGRFQEIINRFLDKISSVQE